MSNVNHITDQGDHQVADHYAWEEFLKHLAIHAATIGNAIIQELAICIVATTVGDWLVWWKRGVEVVQVFDSLLLEAL